LLLTKRSAEGRMASISASTRVVLAALAGNLAVSLTKFVAFGLTRSTAMLTEAIHSLVDTGNQLLLLVGQSRAARPAHAAHPLGHGQEIYFWSFIVALMIFLVGGAVSIWEGAEKLLHPEPIQRPWISFAVLGASAVFEGFSFRAAYREYRRVAGPGTPIWRFVHLSKDPSVFATLLEDSAALTGLALAALGVAGAALLGLAWADGAASIAIGLLLVCVALVLANETRSLIAGEAAAPAIEARLEAAARNGLIGARLIDLTTLHVGPGAILVFLRLEFQEGLSAMEAQALATGLTERMKAAEPRIAQVSFVPAA
jgi:cation diffusion facilitator family transporter